MIRFTLKACFFLALIQLGWQPSIVAQNLTLDFIYGGADDAEVILQEYLKPYANILGSDLNAGWYNTARPHELGGLDVTATVSWARAPATALTFDMAKLDLYGNVNNSSTSIAPTIAGEQNVRPDLSYTAEVELSPGNVEDVELTSYTMPNGTGLDFFPLPMGQLSVGLPFGTDVSARFVPMIGYRDYGEIGLWGVGGKHSISQWIPVVKNLKFLDVSVQGGYTKVSSSLHVLVEPQAIDVAPPLEYNWDDQFVIQKVEGWTTNLIASQTISVLTFYQGIGYASSLVEVIVEGHFPINSVIATTGDDLGKTTYEVVKDPINMKYENFNNLRLNAGARLKLGVFTVHYDFTHTLYSTHSLGVGISFR